MSETRGTKGEQALVASGMTRWILALALVGCADSSPPVEPPAPVATSAEVAEEEPDEFEEDEPEPSLSGADLDEMDRPALEAACFAGQSAACDRLGH